MSDSGRAKRLLEQPSLARLIQVASLVKQVLTADEVYILRPLPQQSGALSVTWYDGDREQNRNSLNSLRLKRRRILSQDQLKSLTSSQLGNEHLSVHYYQDGYLWPQDEVGHGEIQAIRMLYRVDGANYFLIWVRGSDRLFTKQDREEFVSLPSKIANADELSQCDMPMQLPSGEIEVAPTSIEAPAIELTPTEAKVLQLLKQGLTEKAVGHQLNRSPNTVHVHVRSIYRKLLVNSRKELLNKLRRCGEM